MPVIHTNATLTEVSSDVLEAARRGATNGISAVYHVYAGAMLRTATRITGSAADAEDIVHDVFIGLPEFLKRYEHRGQLESWLRSLVIRLALDRMRRELRRETKLTRVAHELRSALTSARESRALNSDLKIDLNRHLSVLPQGLRVVFVLRFFEDKSYEQIAALLHITPGSARVRYQRVLQRLRKTIEAAS